MEIPVPDRHGSDRNCLPIHRNNADLFRKGVGLKICPVSKLDHPGMSRLFIYDEKQRGKNIYLVLGF